MLGPDVPDIARVLLKKAVYQTSGDGLFVGETVATESPLEPGTFLLPGGCVEEPPPACTEAEQVRWVDGAWTVELKPPPPPPVTPAENVRAQIAALQALLDQMGG